MSRRFKSATETSSAYHESGEPNKLQGSPSTPILIIPNCPKIVDQWGHSGSFYRGPQRAFSKKGAASERRRIQLSAETPCTLDGGEHFLAEDLKGAVSLLVRPNTPEICEFWKFRKKESLMIG